ncbi:hypothetical protein F383_24333 [Gossypium arboreum]|uniref:Uncharacterized protein n=1 Tax=Gossypium arboreum TaxID=29729 RepID=A0A0B0MVK2_GOSAR|nr:hypothetical protein F383_24333 [Gossypium arboreum]
MWVKCRCHVLDMVLHWLTSQVDVVSQIWSYTDYHFVVDACPRHVLYWLTSRDRCMSQTCLTLAFVSILMPCPRHGLTLALMMWLMHVLDMSYTSLQTNDPNVMA